ncbi:hypothetical protein [Sphingomonas pruni]|uniref:hypothetical protein n=1 Tax=Sphingomonas pruni TaxID=40683 RepID=UPI0012EECAE0|nr:hypothetical protein [Sphingomonas pruni]
MMIVLTKDDFTSFSPSTRAEILASLSSKPKANPSQLPTGFSAEDFDGVVDLTPGQIEDFMEGCSEETIAGLKVIAEHGPVIDAKLLGAAGIQNYGHFQGRVTKRTRTVTGDKEAYLFAWDDWTETEDGVGQYAVTPTTFRSLRIYFEMD